MNTHIPIRILACLVTVSTLGLAQGPLAPPTNADNTTGPNPPLVGGNPAPSMKTLHQVEPRIPVSAATTPGDGSSEFIISARGSYYLTGNITAVGKIGISITTGDVTLDLNGFVIAVASSQAGVSLSSASDRCTIRNGSIFNGQFGVFRVLSGQDQAEGGSFENLTVNNHSSIGLLGGNGWTVTNCRIQGGSNTGISVGSGSVITKCTVTGMKTSAGTNGISGGEGSVIRSCAVTDCDVISGIFGDNGSVIEGCTVRNNNSTAAGTDTSSGISCDSRGVIRNCVSSNNGSSSDGQRFGTGIFANFSSLVVGCATADNEGAGIVVNQGTVVRGCKSTSNGGAGVFVYDAGFTGFSQLIGNNCTFNTDGFDVDTSGNLIVQNTAAGHSGNNYVAVSGNRIGTVVNPSASGAISGLGTTAAGLGTTDPWANFSY